MAQETVCLWKPNTAPVFKGVSRQTTLFAAEIFGGFSENISTAEWIVMKFGRRLCHP